MTSPHPAACASAVAPAAVLPQLRSGPAGPVPLVVRVSTHPDGQVTVALDGHLDLVNAPSLAPLLASARGTGAVAPRVALDLAGLVFLDLVGLSALLHIRALLHADGAHVQVLHAQGPVLALLRVAARAGWLAVRPPPARSDTGGGRPLGPVPAAS